KPSRSSRLSARHRAIAVSSLHAPRGSSFGPPPTRSATAAKRPGPSPCVDAARASHTARPSKAPEKRSSSRSRPVAADGGGGGVGARARLQALQPRAPAADEAHLLLSLRRALPFARPLVQLPAAVQLFERLPRR